jgi:hypothetical protein
MHSIVYLCKTIKQNVNLLKLLPVWRKNPIKHNKLPHHVTTF